MVTGTGESRSRMIGAKTRSPDWIGVLAAIIALQIAVAFLVRIIPTIGPAMVPEFQWSESVIGYLAAIGTAGSIVFFMAGAPLTAFVGPLRMMQVGLLLGIVGLILLATPLVAVAAIGSLFIGLCYAPSAPAGTEMLQRYAPPEWKNLAFSMKQTGVSLAGVLCAVLMPPLAELAGWRACLVASVGLAVAVIAWMERLNRRIGADEKVGTARPSLSAVFNLANFKLPLRSALGRPDVARLTIVGGCYGLGQGCWMAFLVAFAVVELGYSLTEAGLLYGVMQSASIAGRIGLGFLADRIGSGLPVLWFAAAGSAIASLLLLVCDASWPGWAIAAVAAFGGMTVTSASGVHMAEMARRVTPGTVGSTISGAAIVIFTSHTIGPAIVGFLLMLTGSFDPGFMFVAIGTAAALPALLRLGKEDAVSRASSGAD